MVSLIFVKSNALLIFQIFSEKFPSLRRQRPLQDSAKRCCSTCNLLNIFTFSIAIAVRLEHSISKTKISFCIFSFGEAFDTIILFFFNLSAGQQPTASTAAQAISVDHQSPVVIKFRLAAQVGGPGPAFQMQSSLNSCRLPRPSLSSIKLESQLSSSVACL